MLCGGSHVASPVVCCAHGESGDIEICGTMCGTCSPTLAQALKITLITDDKSPRRVVAKWSSVTSRPEFFTSWKASIMGAMCSTSSFVNGYSDQDAAAGIPASARVTRFSAGISPGISSQAAPPGQPRESRMWLVR